MKTLRHIAKKFLLLLGLKSSKTRNEKMPKPSEFADDDFDWRIYHEHYREQLMAIEKDYVTRLSPGDYSVVDGGLIRAKSPRPLHPNHRLLYETILQLKPASIIEAGCGCGDHLRNLHLLAPGLELTGFDRSREQLAMLRERSPDLKARIEHLDLTLPYSELLPQADIVYTQAFVMHINTGNGHPVALSNLFRMAKKQVVLMENWRQHNFHSDIVFLHGGKMIPWPELHCYYRRVPEWGNRPHLVVVSREPLGYETLSNDLTLVEQMLPV